MFLSSLLKKSLDLVSKPLENLPHRPKKDTPNFHLYFPPNNVPINVPFQSYFIPTCPFLNKSVVNTDAYFIAHFCPYFPSRLHV